MTIAGDLDKCRVNPKRSIWSNVLDDEILLWSGLIFGSHMKWVVIISECLNQCVCIGSMRERVNVVMEFSFFGGNT